MRRRSEDTPGRTRRGPSDELRKLRDELGLLFLEDREDGSDAQFRDAALRENLDDVVEFLVRQGHELVLGEPVPVQVVLELPPPAPLILLARRRADIPPPP